MKILMMAQEDLANHNFGVIGKCIYCGSEEELKTEHIVPYGLGGKSILKKASCENCAKVTSQIEMDVLRVHFGNYRTSMDFPSRRKKEKSTTTPITVETADGNLEEIQLNISESPNFLIIIEYDEPGIYTGRIDTGMRVTATRLIGNKEKFEKLMSDLSENNVKSIAISSTFTNSYARMIAKIAYCYAVGIYSLDNIEQNFVLPYIMDKNLSGLGRFVGCPKEAAITSSGTGHSFRCKVEPEGLIRSRLKLFDYVDAPEYEIFVGTLKKEAIKNFM
ncbi:MAG: HNH endonuclease [Candidatus Methanomethylophilaceae archaeon]|jgi:hypothetical protein